MPRRRRYATREELAELHAGRMPVLDQPAVPLVLTGLADLGVDVDTLVAIEVDEPLPQG